MAKIMNDNFKINVGNPIDSKYLNSENAPYATTGDAITAIPQSQRYVGLTVNVNNVEYWWHLGVTDGDFVIKDSGIASTGITTAINGLTKVGNAVRLGGTLTGTTTITKGGSNIAGIEYAADYSSTFTLRSLTDWGSVVTVKPTGKTANFTLSLPMLGEAVVVTSATPVIVTIPLDSSVNFPIGAMITIQQGGAGVVTASGQTGGVTVNGVVLSTTKQYSFVQYWKTAANTWSVIGGAIEIWQTSGSSLIVPVVSSKRVPIQFISGLTTALSGYVCTAGNGITKVGQNVALGGNLTGNTTISGVGSYDVKLLSLNNLCASTQSVKLTGATGVCLNTTACSACLTLSNAVTGSAVLKGGSTSVSVNNTSALAYLADYSSCYKCLSVPNVGYVTGLTCNIACKANKNIGAPGQIIYRNATQITGDTDMIYCEACSSVVFGNTSTATGYRGLAVGYQASASGTNSLALGRNSTASGSDGSAVFGGCNNHAAADCSAVIAGQNNCVCSSALRSAIIGGQNISLTGSNYNDTVAVEKLAVMGLAGCSDYILCRSADGIIGVTSVSALGGLTGATNGLHTLGQNAHLGGTLIENTHIEGAYCWDIDAVQGFNVRTSGNTDMNIDAQQCGGFLIKSQCGSIDTFPDFTDAVGFLGHITEPAGFAVYDNRTGTGQTGIVYAANYSANYVPRSIVDKQYVDSVATGLNVHTAVLVATTASINLASAPASIDGVTLTSGDRVLVKNQGTGVTGASTNGIYDFNGAGNPMTRATDYDGTPSGEVSNGDLIPVTSGSTNNNSLWALTTLNPITINVTPLIFSLFANTIDIQAGNGIDVNMVGGVHTVSVQLASNCGLQFCGTGLAVNDNIAGNGLGYATGVLNVNASNCGSVPAIPVGYNAGDCLVVACSDLRSAVSAITGATNGLTSSACEAKLGGTLCENTTVCGASTYSLGLTCLTTFELGFGVGDNTGIVTDNAACPRGLQYAGNYSATFVNDSLVTKCYVDACTSASANTFTNGLTKTLQAVCLGGALTEAITDIQVAANAITICDTQGYGLRVDGATDGAVFGDISAANGHIVIDNGGVAINLCGGPSSVNASSSSCIQGLAPNITLSDCLISAFQLCAGVATMGGLNSYPTPANPAIHVGNNFINILSVAGGCLCLGTTVNSFADQNSCVGLQYFANYALNGSGNPRWIPDAEWVTGKTGAIGGNNGLCRCGNNITLGGTLTGNTTIDVACHNFTICGFGGPAFIYITESTPAAGTISVFGCASAKLCSAGFVDVIAGSNLGIEFTGTGIVTDNSGNGFGLQYVADYDATFCNNSLVDKCYVDTKVGCGITSANNGLTKVGQNVALGGQLTGNTQIDLAGHLFTICGDVNTNFIRLNDSTLQSDFGLQAGGCASSTYLRAETHTLALCSGANGATFYDGNSIGLCYAGDYEANFVNRSLVTKQYVLGEITGGTGVYAACNGLHKVAGVVALGGVLTGNTCIDNAGYLFKLTGNSGNFILDGVTNVQTLSSKPAYTNSVAVILDGNTAIITNCLNATQYTTLSYSQDAFCAHTYGGSELSINGCAGVSMIKGTCVQTCGQVYFDTTPNVGSTSDSVLVRSAGGEIKAVTQSSVGDKNNIYAKTTITSSTGLTTGSSYVILANHAGAITITLPATPIDGQAFKIKDISGNAVTNNITVDAGAGKQIDNAQTGSINTDFGALEIMYNSATSKWYSLAFVN